MTAPRLVAVSQRRDPTGPPHDEIRDALDVRLAAFVLAAGHFPVPVPSAMGQRHLTAWLAAVGADAVLLAGGQDVGLDPHRDALEAGLLDAAETHGWPVLGLCRGMQVMTLRAGGALSPVEGHVATRHAVSGDIAGRVNSYHTNAVAAAPDGYTAIAQAEDGTVEAMAHDTLPWEAWMWHPERETEVSVADIDRFNTVLRCGR